MSWIAPLIAGLGGLGGLFGNRPQTSNTGGTSRTNTTNNSTSGFSGASGSNPLLDPRASQGYDEIINKYRDLLGSDPNLKGYQAGQSSAINKFADIQRNNTQENLAARGISGPAVGTALNTVEGQRVGSQIDLSNQIPLLSRQLNEGTLNNYLSAIHGMPTGTYNEQYGNQFGNETGTQDTTQTGTVTQPGNQLGGLFSSLAPILALLYGRGAGGAGQQTNPGYAGV